MNIPFIKYRQKNGLRIILLPQRNTDLVAVKLFLNAGSKDDDGAPGITHFLEHILFQNRKTNNDIFYQIERCGGIINANTSRDNMSVYFVAPKQYLYSILPVVLDMIFTIAIDDEMMDRERKVILQEILCHQNTPDAMWDLFALNYWETNPIRYPIRGHVQSVNEITCSQLKKHYGRLLKYENIVVSCAGDIHEEALISFLENYFMKLPGIDSDGKLQESIKAEEIIRRGRIFVERDTNLTHIFTAFQIPEFGHPDIRYLKAMCILLGGGGYSRLYQKLREEKRIAYGAQANTLTYSETGVFLIHTKCSPDMVNAVEDCICKQIDLLKEKPVSCEELDFIKNRYAGSFMLNFETILSKCSVFGLEELFTYNPLPFSESLKRFSQINERTLQEKANQYLNSAKTILIGKRCCDEQ